MNTKDDILKAALATHDPAQLYKLVVAALELADFHGAQLGFSQLREKQLAEQVKRQLAMIDNLERTLWNKK